MKMVEGIFAGNQHIHSINVKRLNLFSQIWFECQKLFSLSAETAHLWGKEEDNWIPPIEYPHRFLALLVQRGNNIQLPFSAQLASVPQAINALSWSEPSAPPNCALMKGRHIFMAIFSPNLKSIYWQAWRRFVDNLWTSEAIHSHQEFPPANICVILFSFQANQHSILATHHHFVRLNFNALPFFASSSTSHHFPIIFPSFFLANSSAVACCCRVDHSKATCINWQFVDELMRKLSPLYANFGGK